MLSGHYRTMLYKDFLLARKNIVGSIFSVIFPISLMILLVIIRKTTDYSIHDQESLEDVNRGLLTSNLTLMREFYGNKSSQPLSYCNYYVSKGMDLRYSIISEDSGFTEYLDTRIQQIIGAREEMSSFKNLKFKKEEDLIDYVKSSDYIDLPKICFAVILEKKSGWKLKLRYNFTESIPSEYQKLGKYIPIFDLSDQGFKIEDLTTTPTDYQQLFIETGFLTILNIFDNYVYQEIYGQQEDIKVYVIQMPFRKYTEDSFNSVIRQTLPFFIILANLIPVSQLVSQLVSEKEERVKELMLIMGLSSKAYWLSILTIYSIYYTLVALIQAIVLKFEDVLQYSDFGVIFLLLWLFDLTCISFCILLSSFFSRAKPAVILSVMLFLTIYVLNFAVDDAKISMNSKIAASIISPIALSLACGIFADLELGQVGVTFSNASNIYSNYSLDIYYFSMLLDLCVMMILAWYFSNVIPGDSGLRKPWFFIFTRRFWCPRKDKRIYKDLKENSPQPNFEDADIGLKKQISSGEALSIRQLVKTFGEKTVVDNLDLDIFEGQIFALLGHNGAGKTSTISMITGMIPTTQGDVHYQSCSLSSNMNNLRKFIGLCPQQNILFGKLTALEHLKLFSQIKGKNNLKHIESEAKLLLSDLDILELLDKPSRYYSGGQKRKLCLALALIANSKIVLLDEPTSGMDHTARRKMWDLLKKYKQGKIIILTTHYMEEADVLADRIAILKHGKIKCCGSPLFLKNKYGAGFYIKLLKTQDVEVNSKENSIKHFFMKNLPEANLISDIQSEITFQIPKNLSDNLKTCFDKLDKKLDKLGLLSYGVSVTTLEEVFLQVTKESAGLENERIENRENFENVFIREEVPMHLNFKLETHRVLKNKFWLEFRNLFKKRFLITMRDKKSICMEVLIPIFLVLIGLLVRLNNPVLSEFSAYHLTIDNYSTPQKLLFGYQEAQPSLQTLKYCEVELIENKNLESFTEYLTKNWKVSPKRMGSYYKKDSNSTVFVFSNQTALQSSATFYTAYTTEMIRKIDPGYDLKVFNHPLPPTYDMDEFSFIGDGFVGALLIGMACTFLPVSIIGFLMKEKEHNIKHQHIISGMSLLSYWTSYYLCDIVKSILPSIMIPVLTILFNLQSFIDTNSKILAQFVLSFIYALTIFPVTYASTFAFTKNTTAQYVTIGVHFFTGCALPSCFYIMLVFKSLRTSVQVLTWVFKIFPNFCLGWGIMNIGIGKNIAAFYELDNEMNPFDIHSAGGDMMMLGILCISSLGLLAYAEYRSANPKSNSQLSQTSMNIDDRNGISEREIQREYQKAIESDINQVKISVRGITKTFKDFIAVKNLGFNVEDGTCFALLGVNGAGKTTTFKMLTGEVQPSAGKIFIGGSDMTFERSEARTLIGYCPQFDCLNEHLTVEEHLFLYTTFKGIQKHLAPDMVHKIINELDLQSYQKQQAGKLSGGNKRKLSVAIALLGSPSAVLLDEPSAGMDPQARKKMWTLLGKVKKNGAAVILTTHSMEEAEALSDKIAIMVRGEFKCIGSASWIKDKYGDSYEIEVKIKSPGEKKIQKMTQKVKNLNFQQALVELKAEFLNESQAFQVFREGQNIDFKVLVVSVWIEKKAMILKQWLLEKFGSIQEVEHFLSYFKYNLQKQGIQLGNIFSEIQANKKKLKIAEYSISQTSLDQIFDKFAQSDQPFSPNKIIHSYLTTKSSHND